MPVTPPSSGGIDLDIVVITWTSCASHAERALRAVPGVAEAPVSLATETAPVQRRGIHSPALAGAV